MKFSQFLDAKLAKEDEAIAEEAQLELEEAKSKGFIGKIDGKNYAVLIDGAPQLTSGSNFGDLARLNKVLRTWKEDAKTDHVGAKGKATLAAVKKWVKENNPSEYWATWTPDSSHYKDDVVKIMYKD